MRILLVDTDSKIPNLALMKISHYFKDQGYEVGFHINDPDRVYASVIFEENKHLIDGLQYYYPDAEIIIGGLGYDESIRLPPEIEFSRPDYSLYKMDYSLGYTSRGCIRNCEFCKVPEAEGKIKKWKHPEHFHNPDFNKIKILDNNILALKDWFFEITEWILEQNLKVDFNQGLDIRLMNKAVADRIAELDFFKPIKFAWDNPEDEHKIKTGIEILQDSGIDLRHNTLFYVLTNFDTNHNQDLYRCRKLKEWGTTPFVMQYGSGDVFTNHLARWANRPWLFWSIDFVDYDRVPVAVAMEINNRLEESE